jgi:PAS domain S-box-containing protein
MDTENKPGKQNVGVESLKRPASWLVALIIVLAVIFYLLNIRASWDDATVDFLLNIMFVIIPSLFITIIAARGFMRSGVWSVLSLAIGAFGYGMAVFLSMWIRTWAPTGASQTVFALVYLLAGLLYLLGAFFALNKISPQSGGPGRLAILLQVYLIVLAFIAFASIVSVKGWMPPFFIQGSGSTLLRKVVQGTAISLFFLAALAFLWQSLKAKSVFLHWYGLGLLLSVINTAGVLFSSSVSNPYHWVLVVAQLLGGVYLSMAAVTVIREARNLNRPVAEVIAEFTERSQVNYELLVNASSDAIIAVDGLGRILAWNPAAEKSFGYRQNEIIGSGFNDLIASPDDQNIYQKAIDRVGQNRDIPETSAVIEFNVRRKNSEIFPAELTLTSRQLAGLPSVSTIMLIMRDISARKKAEQSLKESEMRFRLVMRHAPVSVAVQDMDLKYIWAFNQKTSLPDEIIGHYDSEIFTTEETAQVTEMKKRVIKEDADLSIQRWFDRPSGRIFMEVYFEPIHDTSGRVIGVGSATVDITPVKMAEEALRESEAKANALIKYAPTGIYEIDFRGPQFLSINDATLNLSGYTREEMFALGPLGILDDDSKKKFTERIKRQLAGEKLEDTIEYRMKRKDGTLAYIVLNVAFSKTNPHTALVIGYDITERIESEKRLKESEENYRNLFNNMSEGFAVCEMLYDPSGKPMDFRFLNVNPLFEKLLGLPHDQILGKTVLALVPNVNPKAIENFGKVVSTGEPVHFENYSRDLKKWFDNYAYRSGRVQFGYMVLDITDRKEAEEAVIESEARFRSVLENSRDVIYRTNLRTGRYEYTSPSTEAILGYSGSELASLDRKTSLAMIHPDDLLTFRSLLAHLEETGQGEGEYRLQTKKGEYRWVSNRLSIIKDSSGRPVYRDGIFRDITERKKAEEVLKESEDKYHSLFATMNEGFILAEVVTNDQGRPVDYRFLDVNTAGEKYFGRPRSKIIGQTYRAIGGGKADPEWIEKLGQVALTREPLSLDSYAPVGGQWVSLKAYSPRAGQFAAVFENITERKKAEDGLKQREDRFRVLIENLRSGVALIDESGQFSVYNSSFLRLFGLSKDSDIMSVNNQKWSDWKVYEEDGKTLLHVDEHPVRKVAMTGKPVRNKLVGVRLPSGGDLIWMVINAEPIISLDGTVQYIIVTYYDITERKNVEEQLRNRAEELETVMNLVPVAIWVAHDPKCNNITGNRTANEFYEAGEGENVSAGPAPGEPIPSRRFFRNGKELTAEELPMQEAAARNMDIQGLEFNVMLSSGKSRTLWGSASPLRDDDGQVRGVVAAFLDITERKQAEEDLKHYTVELESANKELEAFSYSVSHDLRAPLRSLDGFSQAVIEEYGDKLDDQGKDYLNRVCKASQHMSSLINDLLKLSRLSRAETHFQDVNLSEIAQSIMEELQNTQPERKAEFISSPGIVVKGDKSLLTIALQNLLGNAWKFTSKCPQAKIEFGVEEQKGEKVYFIKDNGTGFNMQYSDKLFQPFQRLHSDKEYEGTGIGLATVQRVIRRHGGRVWAESENGKGATFYFTLS